MRVPGLLEEVIMSWRGDASGMGTQYGFLMAHDTGLETGPLRMKWHRLMVMKVINPIRQIVLRTVVLLVDSVPKNQNLL